MTCFPYARQGHKCLLYDSILKHGVLIDNVLILMLLLWTEEQKNSRLKPLQGIV